jgi:hypothetical protein
MQLLSMLTLHLFPQRNVFSNHDTFPILQLPYNFQGKNKSHFMVNRKQTTQN